MPTSAGSWVMFARNPSRSTTGPESELGTPDADEAHPAARAVTAATPAASSTRLMKIHLSDLFSIQINLIDNMAKGNRIRQDPADQGVALTSGARTRCPRNRIAATCVTVSVPAW